MDNYLKPYWPLISCSTLIDLEIPDLMGGPMFTQILDMERTIRKSGRHTCVSGGVVAGHYHICSYQNGVRMTMCSQPRDVTILGMPFIQHRSQKASPKKSQPRNSQPQPSPSVAPAGSRGGRGEASDQDSAPAWRVDSAWGRMGAANPH